MQEQNITIANDSHFSTIVLNDSRKQLLLSSQNYNSNYAIYASFNVSNSNIKDCKTLDFVEFEIINYKPCLFIGIHKVELILPAGNKPFGFRFFLQGMCSEKAYPLDFRGDKKLPQIDLQRNSFIKSERVLIPLFPKDISDVNYENLKAGKIDCSPDNGRVFDSEFFFKDGNHVLRKYNYDENPDRKSSVINKALPGSARCKDALNQIIFIDEIT